MVQTETKGQYLLVMMVKLVILQKEPSVDKDLRILVT
jgi:hypothetical protein